MWLYRQALHSCSSQFRAKICNRFQMDVVSPFTWPMKPYCFENTPLLTVFSKWCSFNQSWLVPFNKWNGVRVNSASLWASHLGACCASLVSGNHIFKRVEGKERWNSTLYSPPTLCAKPKTNLTVVLNWCGCVQTQGSSLLILPYSGLNTGPWTNAKFE